MKGISGNKDVDREILLSLSDRDLLKTCNANKYLRDTVCDDGFFRRRLMQTYPSVVNLKDPDDTWKEYFLEIIYYIYKLYEDYKFRYESGNPEAQYEIFVLSRVGKLGKKGKMIYDSNEYDINSLIPIAAQKGEMNIITRFIDKFDIEYLHEALDRAVEGGNLDIVKYFINKGSKVNDETFMDAVRNGHFEIVKFLFEKYPYLFYPANLDKSLNIASEKGYNEIIGYLLEKGANIHNNRDEPLRSASQSGKLETVKYMIDHGADIHAGDDNALIVAANFNRFEIVKYLIEHGANINAQDNKPILNAKKYNHSDIVNYLLRHGADRKSLTKMTLNKISDKKNFEYMSKLRK